MDPIDPLAGRLAAQWDAVVDGLSDCPMPWPPPGPLVVVSPHPDDELLASGATLAAVDPGVPVTVVAVTDGEWSHPHLDEEGRGALALRRTAESAEAYRVLGVGANRVRLSLPDGSVDEHFGALLDQLSPLLVGAGACVAPWPGDGHPDHEACARAALQVCGALRVPLFGVPIWSWNWDDPQQPAFDFSQAFAFRFGDELRERKQAALACYVSQVQPEDGQRPVLPKSFLDHFARSAEVFLPLS